MSMEDFLFGSDLEDSDDEAKVAKGSKESERDSQLNELFGDSPSEGEDEIEHVESDKEEADSGGENAAERKNSAQEGDDDEEDSEVRNGEFIF